MKVTRSAETQHQTSKTATSSSEEAASSL